jgi:hypothetical protein
MILACELLFGILVHVLMRDIEKLVRAGNVFGRSVPGHGVFYPMSTVSHHQPPRLISLLCNSCFFGAARTSFNPMPFFLSPRFEFLASMLIDKTPDSKDNHHNSFDVY